jgi:hypothetical protein
MPASPDNPPKGKSLETVFITKGIAIILVVWVHSFLNATTPFWWYMANASEKVPMSIFFFLSAYLLGFHNDPTKKEKLFGILLHRAKRLAYPFVTMAVISIVIKLAAAPFVTLDHPVTAQSLLYFLIDPEHSAVPLLWFMYALMMMIVMLPLGIRLFRSPLALFLVSLFCYFLPWPDYFCLRLVFHHFPYYVIGYIVGTKINLDTDDYSRIMYCGPVLAALVGFLVLWAVNENPMVNKVIVLIVGFLSIAAFQMLSKIIMQRNLGEILYSLGFYSMSIYLLHTLFASPIHILYAQVLNISAQVIPISRFASVIAGILGPLLLEKYVLRRYAITKKLFLGILPRRRPAPSEIEAASAVQPFK